MKKTILSLLVALMAMTGAWAQSPTTSGITWNIETNSGTFLMPAYNVEVSTELWYKVDEEKTLAQNIEAYGTKSDFFLNRTLTANVWNTFASPFAIAAGDMEKYFGAGAKVRQLKKSEGILQLSRRTETCTRKAWVRSGRLARRIGRILRRSFGSSSRRLLPLKLSSVSTPLAHQKAA